MQLDKLRQSGTALYHQYLIILCSLAALALPLKLSFAYAFLIPAVILWICAHWPLKAEHFTRIEQHFMFFLGAVILSAALGVDPHRSFVALPSLVFFFLSIPVYREAFTLPRGARCIAWLLIGQSIAAFHSVLQAAFPESIKGIFLGSVTESGQLALTTVIAAGLLLCVIDQKRDELSRQFFEGASVPSQKFLVGLLHLALLIFLGFSAYLPASPIFIFFIIAISLGIFAFHCAPLFYSRTNEQLWMQQFVNALITSILPLLFMALLVNLKRGPWFGVASSIILLLWFFRRRFVVPALLACMILALTIPPVRDRLMKSSEHFFITGGRNAIWDIGVELIQRYPLGIGFDNSLFLQTYSPDIPRQLRHFHNNLLNIVVENGWVALSLFIWWLAALLALSWRRNAAGQRSALAATVGCAILSWQLAGIVEYNFGDSEVVLVAYLLIGFLAARTKSNQLEPGTPPHPVPQAQSAG